MTENENASPISEELDALSCEALGWCLETIENGEPLWPTLFYPEGTVPFSASSGSMAVEVFHDDSPDAGFEAAREAAQRLPASCRCYALAYDGYIQPDPDSNAFSAVILEFGERGGTCAYTACVPYLFDEQDGFLVGEPVPGGEEPLLLG